MNILQIVIIVFVILEGLNILVLYSGPKLNIGNGMGVFKKIQEMEVDDESFALIRYLTNWVANVKVIFAALALTIVFFGDETVQMVAAIALILSTSLFYLTMYPIIRKLDREERLVTSGYSKTLALTILAFILTFMGGLIIYLVV